MSGPNDIVTGTQGHMLQDCSRELSQALASKPDAMRHARDAATAIAAAAAQNPAAAPAVKESLTAAQRADEPATLNLGAICSRLGFTVSGAFLADTLHIQPAKTDKRAALFTESQFATICRQLQSHIGAMAELYAGKPAWLRVALDSGGKTLSDFEVKAVEA